jgi:hypothetical protein
MNYPFSKQVPAQITNYTSKHIAKQKFHSSQQAQNKITNTTLPFPQEGVRGLINTFRKGFSKEKTQTKFKTTKNSRNINNIIII